MHSKILLKAVRKKEKTDRDNGEIGEMVMSLISTLKRQASLIYIASSGH